MSLDKPFLTKDTLFKAPYIDKDEWRDAPVRHRYVHGGFRGTDTRFSFYFPSKEKYQGHFFQYITPVPDNENLSQGASGEEDKIGFSITSGAYFIETNGGGSAGMGMPGSGIDPTIGAYRANAACAQYSRIVAAQIYGEHRAFGYAFGGSGGAYRTIGGIENTEDVWDGAVPYVVGSPMAIPNVFSVRMHAMRVLKNKFPQINDALEPGGSGDMYAGLNVEEKEALQEATKLGFPPKSWFGYKTMGIHAFGVLYQGMAMADRKYFYDDFWKLPGYLGSNAPASLLKARIQKSSKIKIGILEDQAVQIGLMSPRSDRERGTADLAWKGIGQKEGTMPVAFQIEDSLPDIDFLGGDLIIKSGAASGKTLFITKIAGDKILLGAVDPKILALIKAGDEIQVDNSNFLAAQTYYRHQVPGKEYHVWDQFRDSTGKPIYPQRPMLLGPLFTRAASGVLPRGKFKGKMIVLSSLWDREAFPWQADWYRSKVKENLGDSIDNYFRLWYTDHALHGDATKQEDPTHTVSYLGVLEQALRDLSNWVEKGIAPPSTTNYKIEDGQVIVPSSASDRKGIQPTITLKVNRSNRAETKTGVPVSFIAVIEVPPNTGKVVSAEWDFEGVGTFSVQGKLITQSKKTNEVMVNATHIFSQPGTFFTTLRVASERQGNAKTPFARIQNLERVRVVVK
ncbi:MAG: PKD domain-containing protein [Bacteroidetes bacterium]|nr:PKD domain-containing protein [Bacteroidota bacterium]